MTSTSPQENSLGKYGNLGKVMTEDTPPIHVADAPDYPNALIRSLAAVPRLPSKACKPKAAEGDQAGDLQEEDAENEPAPLSQRDARLQDLVRELAREYKVEAAILCAAADGGEKYVPVAAHWPSAACRDISASGLCKLLVRRLLPTVVLDTSKDDRFQKDPLVQGPDGIRFYAEVPVMVPSQEQRFVSWQAFRAQFIGVLCIMDTRPRESFTLADASLMRQKAAEAALVLQGADRP